jgi:MFS family permease
MNNDELAQPTPPDALMQPAVPSPTIPGSMLREVAVPAESPTGVRFKVLGFLAGMTFILYLDRVCFGQANKAIMGDLGLDEAAMGLIGGAFTVAYGVFEIPTGRLGDRYGSRGVLTRIVLWWSFFTALTGAAFGFWMLLVVRFLFGAGEAGALPNTARVLRQWFPDSWRGTAQGVVTTAMLVGGAAAPIASAYLIELVGWRWSFVLFGLVGAAWAWAFWRWFRDRPAEHPEVNAAERTLITAGQVEHDSAAAHPPIPWGRVLTSANVWLLGGWMNCGAALFYMLIFWYSTYLKDGRRAGEIESGWLVGMVLAAGAVGCAVGGRLTDLLMSRTGSPRWSRCGIGVVGSLLGAASLLASLHCEVLVLSAVFVALGFFFLQVQIPAWWATVTQISGKHVGAMFGLMNSLGAIGGALSPVLLGFLVRELGEQGYTRRDQWDPGFYVYVGLMLLAGVLWFFVRPTRSVVEDPAG